MHPLLVCYLNADTDDFVGEQTHIMTTLKTPSSQ